MSTGQQIYRRTSCEGETMKENQMSTDDKTVAIHKALTSHLEWIHERQREIGATLGTPNPADYVLYGVLRRLSYIYGQELFKLQTPEMTTKLHALRAMAETYQEHRQQLSELEAGAPDLIMAINQAICRCGDAVARLVDAPHRAPSELDLLSPCQLRALRDRVREYLDEIQDCLTEKEAGDES